MIMEKNTNNKIIEKKKTVWHKHGFALTDQQQKEFDRLLLKYNINNKTRFIVSRIFSESIKVVVIDQASLSTMLALPIL